MNCKTEYKSIADELLKTLFPICRSITGDGIRNSLGIINQYIPIKLTEIPSGTKVFDWIVPDEWNIRDGYIEDLKGNRILDFKESNLHVVSYSTPVDKIIRIEELKRHLHTLPDQQDAIPYLTSYYKKDWGFCLPHNTLKKMKDEKYKILIDSTLEPGAMTYAESVLEGESNNEILISTYICHPSMANNELSGPILTILLYKYLSSLSIRRYTYRFYFGPETIGALAYLKEKGEYFKKNLVAGLVATCCGDSGVLNYKKVRRKDNMLDRIVEHCLKHSGHEYNIRDFFPSGSDERQYCSPGFNLPVGSITRSVYGEYPEYHTSLDNLDFVTSKALIETLEIYINVVNTFESNHVYINKKPFGEPFLSKYKLQDVMGGSKQDGAGGAMDIGHNQETKIIKYILNFSDGKHDLIDIAEKLSISVLELIPLVSQLCKAKLIEMVD